MDPTSNTRLKPIRKLGSLDKTVARLMPQWHVEPASSYLEADWLKRETHDWGRVRSRACLVLRSMFTGTIPPKRDLAVRRRDAKAEILRRPTSVGVKCIRLDDILNCLRSPR